MPLSEDEREQLLFFNIGCTLGDQCKEDCFGRERLAFVESLIAAIEAAAARRALEEAAEELKVANKAWFRGDRETWDLAGMWLRDRASRYGTGAEG